MGPRVEDMNKVRNEYRMRELEKKVSKMQLGNKHLKRQQLETERQRLLLERLTDFMSLLPQGIIHFQTDIHFKRPIQMQKLGPMLVKIRRPMKEQATLEQIEIEKMSDKLKEMVIAVEPKSREEEEASEKVTLAMHKMSLD